MKKPSGNADFPLDLPEAKLAAPEVSCSRLRGLAAAVPGQDQPREPAALGGCTERVSAVPSSAETHLTAGRNQSSPGPQRRRWALRHVSVILGRFHPSAAPASLGWAPTAKPSHGRELGGLPALPSPFCRAQRQPQASGFGHRTLF